MTHADIHNTLHTELDIGLPTNLTLSSIGHLSHHQTIALACPELGLDTTPIAGETGHTATTNLLASGPIYGPKFGRTWVINHAGPRSVSAPGGSPVQITTADNANFNTILTNNPGATFWIRAGIYNRTSAVQPKINQTLVFESGAILDGGANDIAAITIGSLETGVTLRGGEIRNYGTTDTGAAGRGIIINGADAVLEDISIHNCFRIGVSIQAQRAILRYLVLYDNGVQGCGTGNSGAGQTENLLIEHCNIYGNNTRQLNPGGEGGAFKMLFASGTCRANYVHGNKGFGAWWDTDNYNWFIENNVCEDNWRSGVFYEANYGGIMRHNYIRNNGKNVTIGGQVVTQENTVNVRLSDNAAARTDPDALVRPVEFYRNIVDNDVFDGGGSGRMIILWDHTDSAVRHVANNDIYENQFWIRNTVTDQIRGKDFDESGPGPTTDYQVWDLDNHFWLNEYHVTNPSTLYWQWDSGTGQGVDKTYAQWQAIHTGETLALIQI